MNMTPEIVEQIWGEAVTIYEEGFDLMFDDDTEKRIESNIENNSCLEMKWKCKFFNT